MAKQSPIKSGRKKCVPSIQGGPSTRGARVWSRAGCALLTWRSDVIPNGTQPHTVNSRGQTVLSVLMVWGHRGMLLSTYRRLYARLLLLVSHMLKVDEEIQNYDQRMQLICVTYIIF